MKGGITSGVVYPQAITRLSERFDFRSIGGTSAGAIAAAATAAAQYRRITKKSDEGFEKLSELGEVLGENVGDGKHTRLFHLFQPQTGTRRLFQLLTGMLNGGPKAVVRTIGQALGEYVDFIMLGALPGIALICVRLIQSSFSTVFDLWLHVSVLVALIGGAIGAVVGIARDAVHRLPENGFGLCSGMPEPDDPHRTQEPPLTDWLTGYLNEVAGLDPAGPPLTFEHLWGSAISDPERRSRDIDLLMMTTNLTHRRPYRLPFRYDDDLKENFKFHFRPDEFRQLFPESVVDWMCEHSRTNEKRSSTSASGAEHHTTLRELGYYEMPHPSKLPVVVATRMSLSFPVLLSAVPLHSIDYSVGRGHRMMERCWFSDGGITSNFPLHFFDAALPRRPTFSFDLTEKPDGTEPAKLIPHMDSNNGDSVAEVWHRFDTETPLVANQPTVEKSAPARLLGFFGAIIKTMQNWTDTTQGRLPGYRDRIVRVPLTSNEGGLNLDMPADRIKTLADRGEAAADKLVDRFDIPAKEKKMTWDNHRWIRMRSTLASLENMLRSMDNACENPENDDTGYQEWLARLSKPGAKPPSYPYPQKAQFKAAIKSLEQLRGSFDHWPEDAPAAKKAPRPRAKLRPRPQT